MLNFNQRNKKVWNIQSEEEIVLYQAILLHYIHTCFRSILDAISVKNSIIWFISYWDNYVSIGAICSGSDKSALVQIMACRLEPLLLTWVDFNPSMDK